jgi:hypothetical protein
MPVLLQQESDKVSPHSSEQLNLNDEPEKYSVEPSHLDKMEPLQMSQISEEQKNTSLS